MDLILVCIIAATVTAILAVTFNKLYSGWDVKFLNWFSDIAQDPRWFIVWMLILVLWIPLRTILVEHNKWFSGDGDLILMTILWSVIPFMVENAMKFSSSRQMTLIQKQTDHIADLTVAIRTQLDDSRDRDELLFSLVGHLLDAIEEKEG